MVVSREAMAGLETALAIALGPKPSDGGESENPHVTVMCKVCSPALSGGGVFVMKIDDTKMGVPTSDLLPSMVDERALFPLPTLVWCAFPMPVLLQVHKRIL